MGGMGLALLAQGMMIACLGSANHINKQLASQCTDWPAVSSDQIRVTKAALKQGTKAYSEHDQSCVEWLQADASPLTCAAPQPAIADVAADSAAAAADRSDLS